MKSTHNIKNNRFVKDNIEYSEYKEYKGLEEESKESFTPENNYIHWSVSSNGNYFPAMKTVNSVPSGLYSIRADQNKGLYLHKQKVILKDNLLSLPEKNFDKIITDIEKFWNNKEKFKEYDLIYKRGMILHGPPGNGKSYLIQSITEKITNRNGIVISIESGEEVHCFAEFMPAYFRSIEPDRPIVVIFEDVDNFIDTSAMSSLLNILDGVKQIDNVVYIATTNYPEKLQERISNRPSRFDRKYLIDYPDAAVREFFIKKKLKEKDLEEIDLKKWVRETEKLSLSHIKELIVSVIILGQEFDEVINHFKEMASVQSSRSMGTNKVGFELENKPKSRTGNTGYQGFQR